MMEDELRQLLKSHGWTLYKRKSVSNEYLYAIKWKQGQVYITSASKLPQLTQEEVMRKIKVS